jgi:hypothetical protein
MRVTPIRNPDNNKQGIGILVSGKKNVAIKNCFVQGWNAGIRIENNSVGISLINVQGSYNDDGFDINNSSNISINGGVATRNDAEGIDLDSVEMVMINAVNISNNGDKDISVNKPKDALENKEVHITDSSIGGNGTGIKLQHTDSAYITDNCFSDNKNLDKGEGEIAKDINYEDLKPWQIDTIKANTHSNEYKKSCFDD